MDPVGLYEVAFPEETVKTGEVALLKEAVGVLELLLLEELNQGLTDQCPGPAPKYGGRRGVSISPHLELPLVSDCGSAGERLEPLGNQAGA
jgi:hypothetical protein